MKCIENNTSTIDDQPNVPYFSELSPMRDIINSSTEENIDHELLIGFCNCYYRKYAGVLYPGLESNHIEKDSESEFHATYQIPDEIPGNLSISL
ncbi:hypothetical protein NPIL_556521 [Nephila pilipes]|uniref:Uncharacterized protein n=1 Tax=Nephila pilipes TaxID=299642 RepID=A0A8X6MG11_NEPPI|nr:hypothetical protein NPIL_556521 [Nephila pilipes]